MNAVRPERKGEQQDGGNIKHKERNKEGGREKARKRRGREGAISIPFE